MFLHVVAVADEESTAMTASRVCEGDRLCKHRMDEMMDLALGYVN